MTRERPPMRITRPAGSLEPRRIATVTEEPAPVLRIWIGPELAAELELAPERALALAEALLAAARRALARERDPRNPTAPGPSGAGS